MIRILTILAFALCLPVYADAAASLDLTTPVQSKVVRKIQVGGFFLYSTPDGQDIARVTLRTVGSGGQSVGEYQVQLTDVAGTCTILQRNATGDDVEVLPAQLGAGVLTGFMDALGQLGKSASKAKRDAAILSYLASAGVIAANLAGTVN